MGLAVTRGDLSPSASAGRLRVTLQKKRRATVARLSEDGARFRSVVRWRMNWAMCSRLSLESGTSQ